MLTGVNVGVRVLMWFVGDASHIGDARSGYSVVVFLWSGFSLPLLMVNSVTPRSIRRIDVTNKRNVASDIFLVSSLVLT